MVPQRIGFVGAGQMARALARGFVEAGLVGGKQIWASDPAQGARDQFLADVPGASIIVDNPTLAAEVDVVFLAVKPQQMAAVADEIGRAAAGDKLYVSIAAGITLDKLIQWLRTDRLIRVMPNTPCLVGQSAAGYCVAPGVKGGDGELIGDLLQSVGLALQVDERRMDALTGLSGSGPAYVCTIIEALSDGGVRMGLSREMATALAAQTVRGAAEMVIKTAEHPAVLRDRVTSPGGTTIAGLAALERGGLRAALIAAVEAATLRSEELGSS